MEKTLLPCHIKEVERDSLSQLWPVFKYSYRRAARDRDQRRYCEVTTELRKNLMERQRILVDFNSCRVDGHLGITKCYKS